MGRKRFRSLILVLQIQALAAFILVLAVYLAVVGRPGFPYVWDTVGVAIIAIALTGEALSDAQLAQFRKTPEAKTEICETGLWAYSRHPNYFFEWLFWCAWPLMAITASSWSWLSLLAPIQMYWLLVHVSGIPLLEEHMLKSRGEKFRALQHRVNAFFLGPRKATEDRGARHEGLCCKNCRCPKECQQFSARLLISDFKWRHFHGDVIL